MVSSKAILGKLGGQAFVSASGAKAIEVSAQSVTFRLPAKAARSGINIVTFSVNDAGDGYDAHFHKGGRLMNGSSAQFNELKYANFDLGGSELRECFTYATGIDVTNLEML